MKRAGGLVPAWRNIPKSHSSSILEVESASSVGSWANSPRAVGNGKMPSLGSSGFASETVSELFFTFWMFIFMVKL